MSEGMFGVVKLLMGSFLILMGYGYIYRPDMIQRLYRFVREMMLNDARIMLERKKWGFFFLMMGALFVYMGWTALNRAP